tara:strand:+ start:257 stop:586 length:330 start_codon:yes stop_codon:yes gene_type:complete
MNISKIKTDLSAWRAGFAPFPQEYVTLHLDAAKADLDRLLAGQAARLVATQVVGDGWLDGFKVLRVVAEDRNGFRDFRWSDSNGGSWFEKQPSGGSSLIEKAPTAPGYL